jgi:hypothetical protein
MVLFDAAAAHSNTGSFVQFAAVTQERPCHGEASTAQTKVAASVRWVDDRIMADKMNAESVAHQQDPGIFGGAETSDSPLSAKVHVTNVQVHLGHVRPRRRSMRDVNLG